MKQLIVLFVFGLTMNLVGMRSALAAKEQLAPWMLACSEYSTSNEFIKGSSLYCLKRDNSRACHEAARQRFVECGFDGNYEKLSKRLHAKMLLFIALAGRNPLFDDTGRKAS